MPLQGWVYLGGEELFNNARVHYRVRNRRIGRVSFIETKENPYPTFNVDPYDNWKTIDLASGATSPWWNTEIPESRSFIGAWATDSSLNSPMSRTISERLSVPGGGRFGPPRQKHREVPFSLVLFAEDEDGLQYGMDWLTWRLRGPDDCRGQDALVRYSNPDTIAMGDDVWLLRDVSMVDPPTWGDAPIESAGCIMREAQVTLVAGDPSRYSFNRLRPLNLARFPFDYPDTARQAFSRVENGSASPNTYSEFHSTFNGSTTLDVRVSASISGAPAATRYLAGRHPSDVAERVFSFGVRSDSKGTIVVYDSLSVARTVVAGSAFTLDGQRRQYRFTYEPNVAGTSVTKFYERLATAAQWTLVSTVTTAGGHLPRLTSTSPFYVASSGSGAGLAASFWNAELWMGISGYRVAFWDSNSQYDTIQNGAIYQSPILATPWHFTGGAVWVNGEVLGSCIEPTKWFCGPFPEARLTATVPKSYPLGSTEWEATIVAGPEGTSAMRIRVAPNPFGYTAGDDRLVPVTDLVVGALGPGERLVVDSSQRRIWHEDIDGIRLDATDYVQSKPDQLPVIQPHRDSTATGLIWVEPASGLCLNDMMYLTVDTYTKLDF